MSCTSTPASPGPARRSPGGRVEGSRTGLGRAPEQATSPQPWLTTVCASASQQTPITVFEGGLQRTFWGAYGHLRGSWWESPLVVTLEDQSPLPQGLSALQL